MDKTIDLMSRNTRLTNRFGKLVIPDGETYIHVDGVRTLKLDKTAKCSYGHGIPDTPQFKGLNGETDVTVSYAPHTYYLELPPGYQVMPGGTTPSFPSMSLSTRGSPTTLQMGAHLYVAFVFGVDRVSGAQTELCGADVWSEDGVSIPIICASGIIDPCKGVVCKPKCVGVDRYAMVCKDGKCVRGALMEANSTTCGYVAPVCVEGDKKPGYICIEGKWVPYTPPDVSAVDVRIAAEEEVSRIEEEAVYLPKPECTEGDKKPGYICIEGKWVPYTPEQEAGRLYVKFDIPWLDLLPGIPYEPWMIIPPGFKITEEP